VIVFEFRLQRVLELREQREQETATRLAAARFEADAARSVQSTLEALRTESIERLSRAHAGGAAVGELRNVSYVLEHLNRQIHEARTVAAAADETVRILVDEFTVAFKERRVMDLLRTRRHGEWKAGELSQDRQAMDEVAISRYARHSLSEKSGA
jgi:flagellar protein FliJ